MEPFSINGFIWAAKTMLTGPSVKLVDLDNHIRHAQVSLVSNPLHVDTPFRPLKECVSGFDFPKHLQDRVMSNIAYYKFNYVMFCFFLTCIRSPLLLPLLSIALVILCSFEDIGINKRAHVGALYIINALQIVVFGISMVSMPGVVSVAAVLAHAATKKRSPVRVVDDKVSSIHNKVSSIFKKEK